MEAITMAGQAIFSDVKAVIYNKHGRSYKYQVKRFGQLLKKQKVIPTVRTGYIKNFIESEIITEEEIQRIFKISWGKEYYLYGELTIFTWE